MEVQISVGSSAGSQAPRAVDGSASASASLNTGVRGASRANCRVWAMTRMSTWECQRQKVVAGVSSSGLRARRRVEERGPVQSRAHSFGKALAAGACSISRWVYIRSISG